MPKPTEVRSKTMRAVRSKDTAPEFAVRRIAHGLGYRYRLHKKELPGKPDLVFASKRKVIFVNGCFWHQHECKRGARLPKTNTEYWSKKLKRNVERDNEAREGLEKLGWDVLTIWECETRDEDRLSELIDGYLSDT